MRFHAFSLAIALAACGAPRHTMTAGEAFSDPATLLVELDRSPSGGSTFDFCPRPPVDPPHLKNAAWLAFLAANEYAHLYYLSTLLRDLGFAGDLDWPTCAVDLRMMRGFETRNHGALVAAQHAGELRSYVERQAKSWGACARAWLPRYDARQFPAAAFEHYLIQTAHPGEHVEFFSGGQFEHDGRVFAAGSTQVAVLRHRTLPVLIIAFRGTEPNRWSDIIADLEVWKTALAPGWGEVHAGFRSAYAAVAEALRAKLDEYKGDHLAIWITGHSLGGALATLMAAEVLRANDAGAHHDLRGLYTFGSPRVGDRAFRDALVAAAARHGAAIVRFRNGDDLVTAVPRVVEFEHAGKIAHLRENTIDVGDVDPPYAGLGSVADHDIAGWIRPRRAVSGYYRRLDALVAGKPSPCP